MGKAYSFMMAWVGKLKDRYNKSMARKTLVRVGLRVGMVILLMTGFTYYHLVNVLTRQSLEKQTKYILEKGERERETFKMVTEIQARLKIELLRRLNNAGESDPREAFDRAFTKFPDGTVRTRLEGFDGTHMPFGFFGKSVKITPSIRRRAMIFHDLSQEWGPAWNHRFQNIYFTAPENLLVGYWPQVPGWAHKATADLDMPREEFMWVADQEHNPERKNVWTGLFYDAPSKAWMVSAETPVDLNGRQVATIGHDILLNELLERTIQKPTQGSYSMIFRRDGRLITHPEKIEVIKKNAGFFEIPKSGDPHLIEIFNRVISSGVENGIIENPANDEYIAVAKLKEPEWFLVEVIPERLVTAGAFSTARIVLLLGLLSLGLELFILFWVLRNEVSLPLKNLLDAVRKVTVGDFNLNLKTGRRDELGKLSNTLGFMAEAILTRTITLEESEKKFRTTFENAAVGITLLSRDGEWIQVNQHFCRILGYSQEELAKLAFRNITLPDDFEMEKIDFPRLVSGEISTFQTEKRCFRKDGGLVWVGITFASVRDTEGIPSYFIAIFEDIDARKQDEKLKEDFVSTLSHELRTPLTSIMGSLGLLYGLHGKELSQEAVEMVKMAQRNADQLIRLINDLLDVQKFETGGFQIDPKPINLGELVSYSIAMNSGYSQQFQISLVEKEKVNGVFVQGDWDRLVQVMSNILSNAIKFSSKNSPVEIGLEVVGEQARVTVTDYGKGIPQDFRSRIFQKFSQVDSSDTKTISGTGLGLSICKAILESHGGKIDFES